MQQHRRILLPYLIVGALLIVSMVLFVFDALTVIEAEETEEDLSKVLLLSENYLNGLQTAQINQSAFLATGSNQYLESYKLERERATNRISLMQKLVADYFPDASPKMSAVEIIQNQYMASLDKAIDAHFTMNLRDFNQRLIAEYSPAYLFKIQVLLDQMELDIDEDRQTINENVAFSVKRASISIALMVILLLAILWFGHRMTAKAFVANRKLAEQLEHEATHDALTHLPNRRFFLDWIHKSIAMATRNNFFVAMYFIDLDDFKQVNDRYGHDAGDEVLRVAAQRFLGLMRESDLLVRLGGDEFAVLVSQAQGREQLSSLADRIVASLETPIAIGAEAVHIGVSIGIAVFPLSARNADELIAASDAAMYRAKEKGKNRYCFSAASETSAD